MVHPEPPPLTGRQRHLLFMGTPSLWQLWPFLPLVRRTKCPDEVGLMYDVFHVTGRAGYSAAVFLCNLFQTPDTEGEFLSLPREVYDRVEDVYDAGWRVD